MTLILSAVGAAVVTAIGAWLLMRSDRRAYERDPYRDLGLVESHRAVRRDNGQDF